MSKQLAQWNSGTTGELNLGPRVRIPSALTTKPLSHTKVTEMSLYPSSGCIQTAVFWLIDWLIDWLADAFIHWLTAGSVWLSRSNAAMLCIVRSAHGSSLRVLQVSSPDPSVACLCLSASSEAVWCVLANGNVYVRTHVSADACPQGRAWQRVNLEQLGLLLSIAWVRLYCSVL